MMARTPEVFKGEGHVGALGPAASIARAVGDAGVGGPPGPGVAVVVASVGAEYHAFGSIHIPRRSR
jgi:hypothetical protein